MADNKNKFQMSAVSFAVQSLPQVSEAAGRKWVDFGENNDYFNFVIDLYNKSGIHAAICNTFQAWIHGGGLTTKNNNIADLAKVNALFKERALEKFEFDYKLQGQASFEVIWNSAKNPLEKKVAQIYHMPIERLRAEVEDEECNINHYFYSKDWENAQNKKYKPVPIPVFTGAYKGNDREVYVIKNYRPGLNYYGAPDYISAGNWIDIDGRVSNYHLNNIAQGFSSSIIFSFNSGVPESVDAQYDMERMISSKFGGDENAGRFIIIYNDSKENGVEITPAPIVDADKQYEFIAGHCRSQILVGHRVTSPMLLGIKEDTGLGNNADEIKNATLLFQNQVIKPFQDDIIEAINEVIKPNGYNVDLAFIPYTPIQFENKPTQVQQSKLSAEIDDMTEEDEQSWLDYLKGKGELISDFEDDFELISEVEASDDEEEFIKSFNAMNFAVEDYANPNQRSKEADSGLYSLRYQYSQNLSKDSREFCKEMVGASKQGVIFRYEDIAKMSDAGVNGQFAPKGQSNYSIFKYKGGVYCHHSWKRLIFKRKTDSKGRIMPASTTKEMENDIRVGNNPYVKKKGIEGTPTIDLPNRGSLKN